MKEVKIEKCPFCGGENFIETKVNSYGSSYLRPLKKKGLRSATLFATVCTDCGSVVRTYVRSPKKLLPKKRAKSVR